MDGGDHTVRVMGCWDNILWRKEKRERVVEGGNNTSCRDRVLVIESRDQI